MRDYDSDKVIKIRPKHFIHVLDNNKGITRLEVGSKTITLKDHEELELEETSMISIPPRHYCVILNPVDRKDGNVLLDKDGQVKVRDGDQEIRFEQDPFPLYPGEKLDGDVEELQMVGPDIALHLTALRTFDEKIDDEKENFIHRNPGDEWLFRGPKTYIPRIEVDIVDTITATIIKPNSALKLEAIRECNDCYGNKRKAGEKWLIKEEGAYIPGVNERILGVIYAITLTEEIALSLEATKTFKDVYGKERKAGDKWLVTIDMAETHIVDIYENVIGEVGKTTIKKGFWAKILNPIDLNFKPQLGKEEIREGLVSFFLHPGEEIDGDIRPVYVLGKNESLLLTALRTFDDTEEESKPVKRQPGDKWMIEGPVDYIPTIDVDLDKIVKRSAIPLDDNEGKYVRDTLEGNVRLVKGHTFMLKPQEELWNKELPPIVEKLLSIDPISGRGQYADNRELCKTELHGYSSLRKAVAQPRNKYEREYESEFSRDKTDAVTFRVPPNAICQIYNFKERKPRFVVGPDLVMLEPDEDFTILSLSGEKPKVPNKIKSLALMIGPDFMTDFVDVETSDHAPLRLKLAYNWQFKVEEEKEEESYKKMFSIPDFVGDACKTIASRVRAVVYMTPFDDFHKNSARLIRTAVFGTDSEGHVKDEFVFPTNNLVITNIDIQGVDPNDKETRENLQKSVKIAIKITTDAQEAAAKRNAEKIEQIAKSELELQTLKDKKQVEGQNKELFKQQAENEAVKSTGQAVAEARAKAEAAEISGKAQIQLASNQAEAARIREEADLETKKAKQEAEIEYQQKLADLEIRKKQELAAVNIDEFEKRVKSITPKVIEAIAKAGPELQVKMLEGLNLKSVLITDGKSPVNLFSTAKGLIGEGQSEIDSGTSILTEGSTKK